ncbi:MAG: phage replisome organizer N-terminal domain-containing protein [Desulfobaccales bacterium]
MGRLWGRLYAGTRNHRKIKILAERLPSLWTYWYVLIDLAIEVNDHGWIHISPGIPYSYKELAKELRIRRVDHAKTLCRTLEELRMITIADKGILLNSFSERNFESDFSTPRVRKYREKQKEATKNETDMKRFGNAKETDQNRTDTDQKKGSLRWLQLPSLS